MEQEKETKIVYQIISNESIEEFYTFDKPIFEDFYLKITNYFIKKVESVLIVDEKVNESYSSEVYDEKEISLSEGVYFKTLDFSEIENWYNKTKELAETELKNKELTIYRDLIPELVTQLKEINRSNNSGGNKNKNLLL